MRVSYLIFAAVLSCVAIAARLLGWPWSVAIGAILLAAAFQGLWIWEQAKGRDPGPVTLNDEQREAIAAMKSEGDYGRAMRQVQLWFRNVSTERARELVDEA